MKMKRMSFSPDHKENLTEQYLDIKFLLTSNLIFEFKKDIIF